MKTKLLIINVILLTTIACQNMKNQTLEQEQQQQQEEDRVADSYEEKLAGLKTLLMNKDVNPEDFELFFRVFKYEEELEVWVKSKTSARFTLLKTYPFCTNSGTLGPKRKEGDRQIPEGFYSVNRFNPKSNFYLSLGLNYPNASDLILSDTTAPGSDIFIHGSCISVGCVSITDDKIKEVYLLANEAKNQGQTKIEAHFFPFKLENGSIEKKIAKSRKFKKYKEFWSDLKVGYDAFEKEKKLFDFSVDNDGKYLIRMD